MGRPRKYWRQIDERRQNRHDRAIANARKTPWKKHTINLREGSELDEMFSNSANKSNMVRHVFAKHKELVPKYEELLQENKDLRNNIMKLQKIISGDEEE